MRDEADQDVEKGKPAKGSSGLVRTRRKSESVRGTHLEKALGGKRVPPVVRQQ